MVGQKSNQALNFRKLISSEKLTIVLLLLFALIMRLIRIGTREIAYDDAFSFFLSRQSLSTIIQGTVADTMPPLYYFLLHLFTLISQELWWLRLLNVFLSLLTLLFLYLLAKELFQREIGYLVLLLAATSPFLIYHAQELRMYTLLLLGQVGYLYALIRIIRSQEIPLKFVLMAVLFASIAMYSHNLALLGILICNLVWFEKPVWKTLRTQIFILFMTGVIFTPWAAYLPQQISKVQTAFWTTQPGVLEIMQAILTLFGFAPMPFLWMAIELILLVQVFAIVLLWISRQKQRILYIFTAMAIGLPALLFILSYLTRPVFVPRIFIMSTVIAYLFIALFAFFNWKSIIGKISFVSMLVVSAISMPFYFQFESFPRSSFELATRYLNEAINPGTLILHDNKLSFFPMKYYDQNLTQQYLSDVKGSANDTLAVESQQAIGMLAIDQIENVDIQEEIYFVTFDQVEEEYEMAGVPYQNLDFLRQTFNGNETLRQFGDLLIYHFEQEP